MRRSDLTTLEYKKLNMNTSQVIESFKHELLSRLDDDAKETLVKKLQVPHPTKWQRATATHSSAHARHVQPSRCSKLRQALQPQHVPAELIESASPIEDEPILAALSKV